MKTTLFILLLLSAAINGVLGYFYFEEKNKAIYFQIELQKASLQKMEQMPQSSLDSFRQILNLLQVKP